jgi:hypothetical protein
VAQNPLLHVRGLETQMATDLQERYAPLADEPSHEPLTDAESLGDLADTDQLIVCRSHITSTGITELVRGNPRLNPSMLKKPGRFTHTSERFACATTPAEPRGW